MTLIHHTNVYVSVSRAYDREKYLTIQSNLTAHKERQLSSILSNIKCKLLKSM